MKKFLAFFIIFGFVISSCQLRMFAPPSTPFPTLFVPTADCGSPTLVIGTMTFQIQTLAPAADGSYAVPADGQGIAYWVKDTNTNPVFVISPTPENLTCASTVSDGTTAKLTWSNCNSTTYTLSAGQPGTLGIPALSKQSNEGITIFFEMHTTGAGTAFKGELAGQTITTVNTPDTSQKLAEISLLETSASKDGKSVDIAVSINNYGSSAFTLSPNDVVLTPSDGTPISMTSSNPALPKEIAAGKTETFHFTFPRPAIPTATLKVLTAEYDVEGY
jgi:hypothetical protein